MSDRAWSEQDSRQFIDDGQVFVPERARQLATIAALVPATAAPFVVLELACGEGLLAEALLARHPQCRVVAIDGSPTMVARAQARLAAYGDRFSASVADLADPGWRAPATPPLAIVSSLAIHHLDDGQKRALFRDCAAMLAPGGALIIADVVALDADPARRQAADAWEEIVERQALALTGGRAPLERFVADGWNMYRSAEIDPMDKPAPLRDQLRWLEQAGLRHVDVAWMLAGHAIFHGSRAG